MDYSKEAKYLEELDQSESGQQEADWLTEIALEGNQFQACL